jgi:hypothetical protein
MGRVVGIDDFGDYSLTVLTGMWVYNGTRSQGLFNVGKRVENTVSQ